jgi:DNA polymerase elongation subunit (family B)
MITFHVLDALTQDIQILRETEEVREFQYCEDPDFQDDDDEILTRRNYQKSLKQKQGVREMIIHLFGTTAEGKHVRLSVNGFKPFFYVEIPARENAFTIFRQILRSALLSKGMDPNMVEITQTKNIALLGYSGDRKQNYAKLETKSLADFRSLRNLFLNETSNPIFPLYHDDEPLKVYDAKLDPMLRFFHMRNIDTCAWVEADIEWNDVDADVLEADCHWEDISPNKKPPTPSAPFMKVIWDIECYSENREFPLTKKGYERVAKLLIQHAEDGKKIPEMICGAFRHPEKPPPGMEPLRVKGIKEPNFEKIDSALQRAMHFFDEHFQNRSTWTPTQKEEKTDILAKTLNKILSHIAPLAGDPIIQIGVVLAIYDIPKERHIWVLGTCDPIPGIVVHSFKNEKDLLLDWATTMGMINPDILEGYNIFGFDERYVWERAKELGITDHPSFQTLNRLADLGGSFELQEKFLSSSAMGDNLMYVWSTSGRLQVDLYHYIKRNYQLPAYKLDDVCMYFMSGQLSRVDRNTESGKWKIYTKITGDILPGRYVVLLDDTGEIVVDKMKILEIENGKALIVEASPDPDIDIDSVVKWAIVKDDLPPTEIFRLHEGNSADRARIAAYCIQDCDLVLELSKKLEVLNKCMSMANVCSVPISYIFMRGQGIKIESVIFKYCHENEIVIEVQPSSPPHWKTNNTQETEESYEGAIVLDPVPGFYSKSPIGVCDFSSLYPSTIISENISYDSLVWVKDFDLNGKFVSMPFGSPDLENLAPPGTRWTDISFDIWSPDPKDTRKNPEKRKVGLRICRYAQKADGTKHTLPNIVAKLLDERKKKRKEAEKETDPFRKALLDAEQLAYKLTANSLYGQLGSSTFKIRLQYLAASVTAYGRLQLLFAKEAIEQFYGPEANDPRCNASITYGDTDSLFIDFQVRDPTTGKRLEGTEAIQTTIDLTVEAGKFVTSVLKKPHDFEFDKAAYPFIIFSKKRYVYNKYEDSATHYKQTSMGIVLKRRDNAPVLKTIYGGAVKILLNERDVPKAAAFVKEKCLDMVNGKMSLSQLTITKSLRADYKATPPAHKILADRIRGRDPGNAPNAGERIGYVYICPPTGQSAPKLQGDRIETPAYIRAKKLRPDIRYYIDHQLIKPISQLFSVVLEDIPGFKRVDGRLDETMREAFAAELLFREAYAQCDKIAMRDFATRHFQGGVVSTRTTNHPRTRSQTAATAMAVTETTAKKQGKLDSYFVDKLLLEQLKTTKKKEKKDKKKEKEWIS